MAVVPEPRDCRVSSDEKLCRSSRAAGASLAVLSQPSAPPAESARSTSALYACMRRRRRAEGDSVAGAAPCVAEGCRIRWAARCKRRALAASRAVAAVFLRREGDGPEIKGKKGAKWDSRDGTKLASAWG